MKVSHRAFKVNFLTAVTVVDEVKDVLFITDVQLQTLQQPWNTSCIILGAAATMNYWSDDLLTTVGPLLIDTDSERKNMYFTVV